MSKIVDFVLNLIRQGHNKYSNFAGKLYYTNYEITEDCVDATCHSYLLRVYDHVTWSAIPLKF